MLAELQNYAVEGTTTALFFGAVYAGIEAWKTKKQRKRDNGSSLHTIDASLQEIAKQGGQQIELLREHSGKLDCIKQSVGQQREHLKTLANRPCAGSDLVRDATHQMEITLAEHRGREAGQKQRGQ